MSAQNHSRLPGLWDDDALLAMWVRAGVLALEKYADRTGDRCYLTDADLMKIAAAQPVVNALKKLARLVRATPINITCRCGHLDYARLLPDSARIGAGLLPDSGRIVCRRCSGWILTFPNLAKKQFNRKSDAPSALPSASATATTTAIKRVARGSRVPSAPLRSAEPPDGWLTGKASETRARRSLNCPARSRSEPESSRREAREPPPAEAVAIAERLRAKLTACRRPPRAGPAAWATQAAAWLRARDRPVAEECLEVIEWLFDSEPRGNLGQGEYAMVVDSIRSLRDKYTRALHRMGALQQRKGNGHGRAEAPDWAAAARELNAAERAGRRP